MRRRPDVPSIVAGLVLVALGVLLLADATGTIALTFEVLAPAVCGAVGAILLAVGLGREH